MKKIDYTGPFKKQIKDFIELKQSIGYKYNTEAENMLRFDRFTHDKYPDAEALTKDMVLSWCSKRSYEAQANQCSRASLIRQFGLYLDSIDIKAYILPKKYYPSERQYVPYIYSIEELTKFFTETDKCHYSPECPYRHRSMPVIFRMIYMCGLRLSEARLLRVEDVDLDLGILCVNQSKKDNSRLVPMSDVLTNRCRVYSSKVHTHSAPNDYYFPALDNKPMTIGNVYKNFRRFLWRARISHGGMGHGPRIHDLRHTFAVHCLKKWSDQDKDLTVYLPILKTYLGHDSFKETAYYLHLTADVFPHITLKVETCYPGIIPDLEGDGHETN